MRPLLPELAFSRAAQVMTACHRASSEVELEESPRASPRHAVTPEAARFVGRAWPDAIRTPRPRETTFVPPLRPPLAPRGSARLSHLESKARHESVEMIKIIE
jgi:hypothetical protein